MELTIYIRELLYRYDCVIVHGFGGFVTNITHTQLIDGVFYPPGKQVSFNPQLTHNDGLLANEIASIHKISFEESVKKISKAVSEWRNTLENESLSLEGVGILSFNDKKQIVFQPDTEINFLTSSFGFLPITSSSIERCEEDIITLHPVAEEVENSIVIKAEKTTARRKTFAITKYAAAVAILLTGISAINQLNKNNDLQNLAEQQNQIEQKIQKATFIIDNQLPTINLNVVKENIPLAHIIVGSFQLESNAHKKIAELKKLGYDSRIIGKNDWGLTQVSIGGYNSKRKAQEIIKVVRETIVKDAWILIK